MNDTIAEGGQCLVFVNSRRNAEGFAKRAASAIRSKEPALADLAQAQRLQYREVTQVGPDIRILARWGSG